MHHVNDDQLLLLVYGELADAETRDAEAHLAACQPCRARLEQLERARVASEWSGPRARRLSRRWIAALEYPRKIRRHEDFDAWFFEIPGSHD